jgi:membrane protein implicated in regulation of membrane protease activity
VNVLWALLNLVVGYALFRAGNVWSGGWAVQAMFFAAIAVISTAMSVRFAQKHRES